MLQIMNINDYLAEKDEKPFDRIPCDGGFCSIFRTIACVGDSLSSGEFESMDENGNKGYHDMYEYSWGQYIARMTGAKVYNFSSGGMNAAGYEERSARDNGYWDTDKLCQAYIMALGVNDIINNALPLGSIDDVCFEDYTKNKRTFAGKYAAIIQRYKLLQPEAKFFLVTMPREEEVETNGKRAAHAGVLYDLAGKFNNTYVIDLYKYGPVYDEEFRNRFYLGGHMNAMGYVLTAKMIAGYIDYIIRKNPDDFKQVPFIGSKYWYHGVKR